jgi:hypothetical protein
MPYIGNTPADKFLTLAKQNFSTSATTSYTLDSAVSSTQDIALFINNVRQSPVDAYSVSGTALTLTSATAGTDEMYCVFLGKTVGTVSPASDSVTTSMIQADAVTTAKILNNNVTGEKLNTDVISAQTALGATPADTDELLVSDAGVLKRVDYSYLKSGGLVYVGGLVSTSATAYYQVDNVFTATYSRYLVTFKIVPVTTGAGIDLQFRTSAPGTLDASEYEYSLNGFDSGNSATYRDGAGTTTVQLTHGVNNDTTRNGMVGVMYFSEPDSGDRCVVNANYMYLNDSAVLRTMIGSITYKATGSAIAGFQFAGTGGTANDNIARGSIRVYGIVDS